MPPEDPETEQITDAADPGTAPLPSDPPAEEPGVTPDPAAADEKPEEKPKQESMLSTVERIMGIGKKDKAEPVEGEDTAADKTSADPATAESAKEEKKEATPEGTAEEAAKEEKIEVPKEIAEHPAYKKLQHENTQYAASHEKMTGLNDFMATNNLAPQDMNAAINQAALRKISGIPDTEFQRAEAMTHLAQKDPQKFYENLVAMVDDYGVFLGHTLPADLQKDVDEGNMTKERAQELAKANVDKRTSDRKAETATGHAHAAAASTIEDTQKGIIDSWFERTGKKDIELNFKVTAIEGEMLRLLGEQERAGHPFAGDQAAVFGLLDEAHKNVTTQMRVGRHKQPIEPNPRGNPAPLDKQEQNQTPEEKQVDDVLSIMNRNAG